MSISVDVYKSGIKLGSGTATNGSATIASFSHVSGIAEPFATVHGGRNVQVTATSGTNAGATMDTRVKTDSDTSLVLTDPVWFS